VKHHETTYVVATRIAVEIGLAAFREVAGHLANNLSPVCPGPDGLVRPYVANPLPLRGRGQGQGGVARRYRIGPHPVIGLSAARKLASVVRGRVAAGDDPQSEKRAKRETARRRRLGATVEGALATWLRDEKLGPLGRWKGGLEGGSGRTSL
jgi:hypothetical protein